MFTSKGLNPLDNNINCGIKGIDVRNMEIK